MVHHTTKLDTTKPEYNLRVQEEEKGNCKILPFSVSEDDAKSVNLRAMMQGDMRTICAGTYWKLIVDGLIMMSNTPSEVLDLREIVYQAKGQILINGLGLGVLLEMILAKPEVEHIEVIENSPDVIHLVGRHYDKEDKVDIIEGDAYTWKPPKGKRYDVVWHDIWPAIDEDNLEEMGTLHRRYGRRTYWQDSWGKLECLRLRRGGYR